MEHVQWNFVESTRILLINFKGNLKKGLRKSRKYFRNIYQILNTAWNSARSWIFFFCSTYFIRRRYCNTNYNPTVGLLPNKYFSIALGISTIITQISKVRMLHFDGLIVSFLFSTLKIFQLQSYFFENSIILHFCIGAICFAATILVWLFEERQLVAFCRQNWKEKHE